MIRNAVPAGLCFLLGACATTRDSAGLAVPRAPLELRMAQTRSFEAADARLVLKAALNVLQDEGFVIREANAELGLVTAVLERQSTNHGLRALKWAAVIGTYGAAALLPWPAAATVTSIEANVNVTSEGQGARIRVSLVAKTLDRRGNVQKVEPVADAMAYQRLLAGLDKGVYLQREGL
jgi:hypothetical protein